MTIVSLILVLFALGITIIPGISALKIKYKMAQKRAKEDREIEWGNF